jgi:hypothetical protein
MEKQRRRFTGTEKVALIKKHLVDHVTLNQDKPIRRFLLVSSD